MTKYVWTITNSKYGNASGNTPEEALIKFKGMFPKSTPNTTIRCIKSILLTDTLCTPADLEDYLPQERVFSFFGKLREFEDRLRAVTHNESEMDKKV